MPHPHSSYVASMDSVTLPREHLQTLQGPIGRQLRYLGKLRERLERRGFVPLDPLYERVNAAFIATHALSVHLHYMTCDPGSVGRPGDSAP